jgi:hypothetical protein
MVEQHLLETISPQLDAEPNGLFEEKGSNETTENTEIKGLDHSNNTTQNSKQMHNPLPQVTSPLQNEISNKNGRITPVQISDYE